MKKVLFATTALIATAGVAAADVTLSGSAEMGLIGGSNLDNQFHTDIDVTFKMSGETDGGLAFGATIDLDEEGGFGSTNGGPEAVFISGDFGRLTMGDTDGAFDFALTETGMGGAIADDHTSHQGYSGNGGVGTLATFRATGRLDGAGLDGIYDGQILRYDYSMSGLTVAVSAEVADENDITIAGNNFDLGPVIGLGASYKVDGLSIGGAYQMATWDAKTAGVPDGDFSAMGLSLGYSANGVSLVANASETKLEEGAAELTVDHVGIGASYTMDALTIAANWGQFTAGGTGLVDVDTSGYGVAVNYALGGGATVQFGYGSSDFEAAADVDTWSLGIAMSF